MRCANEINISLQKLLQKTTYIRLSRKADISSMNITDTIVRVKPLTKPTSRGCTYTSMMILIIISHTITG